MKTKSTVNCQVCGKVAEPAYSLTFTGCPHTAHGDCCEELESYSKCPVCAGKVDVAHPPEPHTDDGIDYVLNPGTKSAPGVIAKVAGYIPFIGKKQQPASALPPTVESLLKKRIDIPTIISTHNLGLDHALKEGVMIDDYLVNGYGLKDLAHYEYIYKHGQRKALTTLTTGLGLCANHLRDYPHLIPLQELQERTGLETSELCTVLGLEFPEEASLHCFGDTHWNAKDCVALGLKMDDLVDFGLKYTQQWADLMKGLSTKDILKAEKQLEATQEQVEKLVDLDVLQAEEDAKIRRAAIVKKQSRIKQVQPPPPEEESEEEEEEEESDESEDAPAPAPAPKAPVTRRAPVARPIKRVIPNRYARHGFIDSPK